MMHCVYTYTNTRLGLSWMYVEGLPLLNRCNETFEILVKDQLPKLYEYFEVNMLPMSAFVSPWFHTLLSWKLKVG